jgi:hypothetical protein
MELAAQTQAMAPLVATALWAMALLVATAQVEATVPLEAPPPDRSNAVTTSKEVLVMNSLFVMELAPSLGQN